MRVLFFSTDFPQPHDSFRAVFNLKRCQALTDLHDVAVLSPSSWIERASASAWSAASVRMNDEPLPSKFFEVRHPVFYYPPGVMHSQHARCLWWSCRHEARALMSRFRPDVVLSYWTYPDGDVARRLAHQAGIPAVAVVGGSDVMLARPGSSARTRVARVLHQADAIITVNDTLRQRIVSLGVNASKIHVMAPAVDKTVFFPGDRRAARERLGVSLSRPMAVWVGRMVPVKGLNILIDAVAALDRDDFAFDLHLIGEGPLRRELERRVARLERGSSVTFHGPVAPAGLADWFRAADASVLPSLSEGMPNVLLESMACGTPFVASDVGGIPTLAARGVDVLVPPGDAEALASALRAALSTRQGHTETTRPIAPTSWRDQAIAISGVLEMAVAASMERTADGQSHVEPALSARRSRAAGD